MFIHKLHFMLVFGSKFNIWIYIGFGMDFILPGHYEIKLFISKEPESEGLGNEDKVPCPRALPPLPADSKPGPHDWESLVLSTEPQQLYVVLKE